MFLNHNRVKKIEISDILTWVECFNSYGRSHEFFPARSSDLLAYMALIIRKSKRFGGSGWFTIALITEKLRLATVETGT